jgi:DNA-binding NarL/FixJ family response regulator
VIPQQAGDVRTVLVCDDQQHIRDAIKVVLAGAVRLMVVGAAVDGDTCVQQVEKWRPDVLILDYSMPGGGPQVARAARDLHPAIHIIVFTGRHDASVRDAMLDAGADQFVVKTGRLRPLMDALDRASRSEREAFVDRT